MSFARSLVNRHVINIVVFLLILVVGLDGANVCRAGTPYQYIKGRPKSITLPFCKEYSNSTCCSIPTARNLARQAYPFFSETEMFVDYGNEVQNSPEQQPRLYAAPNFPNATNKLTVFDSNSEVAPNDIQYDSRLPFAIKRMYNDFSVSMPQFGADIGYVSGLSKPTMTPLLYNSTVYQYLYSQKCRTLTSSLLCSVCEPNIGMGKIPGVCVEQCEDWQDSCQDMLARTNDDGHIIPCTELEIYKIHRDMIIYELLYHSLDFSQRIGETFFAAMDAVKNNRDRIVSGVDQELSKNATEKVKNPEELSRELTRAMSNEPQLNPETQRHMMIMQEQARVFTSTLREARQKLTGGVEAKIVAQQGVYSGNTTIYDNEGNAIDVDIYEELSPHLPSLTESLVAMNTTLQQLNITQAAMLFPATVLSLPHLAELSTYLNRNNDLHMKKDSQICKPLKDIVTSGVELCDRMNVPVAHPVTTIGLADFTATLQQDTLKSTENAYELDKLLQNTKNVNITAVRASNMEAVMPLSSIRKYKYKDLTPVENANPFYNLGRDLFLYSLEAQTDITHPEWYKLQKQTQCAYIPHTAMLAMSDAGLRMPEEMVMQQSLLDSMGGLNDHMAVKRKFTYEEELRMELEKKQQQIQEVALLDRNNALLDDKEYLRARPYGLYATKQDVEEAEKMDRVLLYPLWDEFPSVARQRHATVSYEMAVKMKYDRLHFAKGWTWDQKILYYIYHYNIAPLTRYLPDTMARALSQIFNGLLNPMLHSDQDGKDPGIVNVVFLKVPHYSLQQDKALGIWAMCTCMRLSIILFLALWAGTIGYITFLILSTIFLRYIKPRFVRQVPEGYALEHDGDGNKVGFDYDKYANGMINPELIKARQERMKQLEDSRLAIKDNSHIDPTLPINETPENGIMQDVDFSSDDDLTPEQQALRKRMGLFKSEGHVLGKPPAQPEDKWAGMELSKQDKQDVKKMKEELLQQYRKQDQIEDRPSLDNIKKWLDVNRNTKKNE